jgi:hypothetical protein
MNDHRSLTDDDRRFMDDDRPALVFMAAIMIVIVIIIPIVAMTIVGHGWSSGIQEDGESGEARGNDMGMTHGKAFEQFFSPAVASHAGSAWY